MQKGSGIVVGLVLTFAALLLCPGCVRSVAPPPPSPVPYSGPAPYQNVPYAPSPQTAPPASGGRVAEKCLTDLGAKRTITHEVGPLETIWRLSRMYDVPEEAICAANRIRPGEPLRIGQKLVIPNAGSLRNIVPLYANPCWRYIIIHHTATDIGNALIVNRSHHDRGFWNGIGYHFIIDNGTLGKGDGQIEVSPRWIKQQNGAHCKAGGMNDIGIGVALVGNFNVDLPTEKQLASLAYLLRTLSRQYRIDQSHIKGHREIEGASTDCPGRRFPWRDVWQCFNGS